MASLDPRTFNRLLLRSVAVPVGLLATLAALLVWEVEVLLEADRMADQSDATVAQAVRVRQLLIDRETGLRGFLLTGRDVFLEPYEAAGQRLPSAIATLEAQVSGAPEQRARMAELRERWRDWEAFATRELDLYRAGSPAWRDLVVSGEGKRRMDGLRALLDSISDAERTRASVQGQEVEAQARLVVWGGAAWLLLVGVLLAFIGRRQLLALARDYESLLARAEAQARELRASEARLEGRVAQRTQELTLANRELETFSYSVSHDLRAPLRAVDGFSQALLEDEGERLTDDGRELLRRLRAAATRMGQLIDDLLNLSRVTRAELRREPVDLCAVAGEVAEELKRREPGRAVDFDIATCPPTRGDPRLLRVALENLLGNAWKFTSHRSGARITFFSESRDGQTHYAVRDNGVGFDMAYAQKLFSPFQRLHKPSEFPGSGIGLATVQRIIQRHGGHIHAEAVPGEGATFRFTLEEGRE